MGVGGDLKEVAPKVRSRRGKGRREGRREGRKQGGREGGRGVGRREGGREGERLGGREGVPLPMMGSRISASTPLSYL